MLFVGPTATSQQIAWHHAISNDDWLSVVAKRTYLVDRGRLLLAPEQEPLRILEGDPSRTGTIVHEADIYPFKPLTDIVVQGHAYPPRPQDTSFIAKVEVGPASKALLVVGDRQATLSPTGRIIYSPSEPIEKVPLTYEVAYGGIDLVAEEKYGNPMMAFDRYRRPEFQPEYHSPFIYPRNAAGRGYLIEATREAVDALQLPNIEDPYDPISKRGLAVENVLRWPSMPLPWGTNWLHPSFFPRIAYLGASRQFEPPTGPWPEVRRGFAEAPWPKLGHITEAMDYRFFNAGSLGLQLPPLQGDLSTLEFRLVALHPTGRDFTFRLPAKPPRIWVDGRNGSFTATNPVVHHLVIEPDRNTVHVVWRGHARALRPYTEPELEKMPYKIEWD